MCICRFFANLNKKLSNMRNLCRDRMRNTSTMPSVQKIAQSIRGKAMDIVMTQTMYAAVTGMAVTAVVTAIKDISMITVRSVSAWTLH